jgi:hypothetical protein
MRKGLLIFVAAAVILMAQDVPESSRQGQLANTRPADTAGASSASAQDLCVIEGLVEPELCTQSASQALCVLG